VCPGDEVFIAIELKAADNSGAYEAGVARDEYLHIIFQRFSPCSVA
jgi:hypothetical protein